MKHLNVQSATNAKNQDQVNIYSNFFNHNIHYNLSHYPCLNTKSYRMKLKEKAIVTLKLKHNSITLFTVLYKFFLNSK